LGKRIEKPMNDFHVTVLGSGSAVPTSWHNPTSQLIHYKGKQFMVDCGEGTQMQMIRFRQKLRNLDHIMISHLHGDHYYGLIGQINSMHLLRREKPLKIFAPRLLEKALLLQLEISNTRLEYKLEFNALEDFEDKPLYSDHDLVIECFPLKHSVPVWGFLFREKLKARRLDKSFIEKYNPEVDQIKEIVKGGDFITPKGEVLANEIITLPPKPPRSYAFCSDTAYLEVTADYVRGVNLLYHESTFDESNRELAVKTDHATAAQAAKVAKDAGAGKLLLGHYSARYNELELLLEEAREVFPESYLSKEGETYTID
jgi:ribonuclease Z